MSEEDVGRETQFEHLDSVLSGPLRWLYQVYGCARILGAILPDAGDIDDAGIRRIFETPWDSGFELRIYEHG